MNLIEAREQINRGLGELAVVREMRKGEETNLLSLEQYSANIEQAQVILQHVSQLVQQQAHNRIANVVTRCLETVFDNPYTFRIHFERKRGKTEAKLVFEREGLEVEPMEAAGGGVVDVASFALRLSCLMLIKPKLRRLLVLDEPFKFVSSQYRKRVRQMLEELAKEFHIQFIIVTHISEFRTGKIVEL